MTFAQKKPMVTSLQASLDLLIDAGKQRRGHRLLRQYQNFTRAPNV
jgi:hypothetical protein